jgi:hypothetical protein
MRVLLAGNNVPGLYAGSELVFRLLITTAKNDSGFVRPYITKGNFLSVIVSAGITTF